MGRDLNVLVTCGRVSTAVPLVRALHVAGARIDVADSYKLAPALHSNAADQIHVVAPAAREPLRFAQDIAEIVRRRRIDLVVPAFEEGFFLARYAELLAAPCSPRPSRPSSGCTTRRASWPCAGISASAHPRPKW